MTRQDYIRIARAIQQGFENAPGGPGGKDGRQVAESIREAIITELYEDNPRFSRDKFEKAVPLAEGGVVFPYGVERYAS